MTLLYTQPIKLRTDFLQCTVNHRPLRNLYYNFWLRNVPKPTDLCQNMVLAGVHVYVQCEIGGTQGLLSAQGTTDWSSRPVCAPDLFMPPILADKSLNPSMWNNN